MCDTRIRLRYFCIIVAVAVHIETDEEANKPKMYQCTSVKAGHEI